MTNDKPATVFPASNRRSFLKGAAMALCASSMVSDAVIAQTKQAASSLQLNVRDFGAVGDGSVLDTASLQRAIDRVNVLGGGDVVVSAGRYLIGGISLVAM